MRMYTTVGTWLTHCLWSQEIMSQRDASKLTPFAHFNQYGRLEGRIWHAELCDAKCDYVSSPYHWVDAQALGIEVDQSNIHGGTPPYNSNLDDGYFDVELPFAFPFFGQRKHSAKISTNGYLTFSGGHSSCTAPNRGPHDCGASYALPDATGTYGNGGVIQGPTDMIAVYWTDLDLTHSGSVHTYTIDPTTISGGQHTTSCAYGVAAGGWVAGAGMTVGAGATVGQACCAASCGTCGGGGCDQRPGGVEACCTQHVMLNAPSCSETGGHGPCNIDEKAFVIEWADVTVFGSDATAHFEVILYESGSIKMVYQDIPRSFASHAPPSAGIQNAAGNEGISTSFNTPPEPGTSVMIGQSCGSTQTVLSIGFCPGAWGDVSQGTGGAPTGVADPSGASHCTYDFADNFCYTTYGGQLRSVHIH